MDARSRRDQALAALAEAQSQAQAGHPATALAAVPAALVLAPEDAEVLGHAADLAAICNAPDIARHCRDRAATCQHNAPALALAAARRERQSGRTWPALDLLTRALAIAPNNINLLVELAEVEIQHGNSEAAAQRLEAAFAAGLTDLWVHRRYMHLITGLGAYTKLLAHRATIAPIPGTADAFHADLLAGHAKLALAGDHPALLANARAREASPRFLAAPAVQSRLATAIRDREPYSVVRLGDGEGRFLAFLDPALDALTQPEERRAIGQSIWTNWFASDLSITSDHQLRDLRELLVGSLEQSDVIGLPLAERLVVDHFHRGYLAYLDRLVAEILHRCPAIHAADAFLNTALHQLSPFCADLLRGQDFVGVISPHPDLAARLADHLGIPTHTTWLIPGEMRLPERPDLARGHGHFPKRYSSLMAELALPRRGAVVLVAAGLLGKIYCARVKALGGIAIDIGSVADAWTGYHTRPGQYQPPEAWFLP